MKKIVYLLVKLVCVAMGLPGFMMNSLAAKELSGFVPQTGQTTSYKSGDDGDLKKGVVWPIPRFKEHENGTIQDELTGLIWMKNANCWPELSWQVAVNTINHLNANRETCAGYVTGMHTDWRLPTLYELQSLLDASHFNPALPADHPFQGILTNGIYWSNTTMADTFFNEAWYVNFKNGYMGTKDKNSQNHLWPVRGGP